MGRLQPAEAGEDHEQGYVATYYYDAENRRVRKEVAGGASRQKVLLVH